MPKCFSPAAANVEVPLPEGATVIFVAVDDQIRTVHGYFARVTTVHRVVLEQVRQRLSISEVVYRDEIQIGDALILRRAAYRIRVLDQRRNILPVLADVDYATRMAAGRVIRDSQRK